MKTITNQFTSIFLLPAWLFFAVAIFMISNRISYIHSFSFMNWRDLINKIPPIHAGNFAIDILYSVMGIVIFSSICTGVGLMALEYLKISDSSNLARGITAFTIGEILFSFLILSIISMTTQKTSITIAILTISGAISIMPLYRFITNTLHKTQRYEPISGQKFLRWAIVAIVVLSLLLTSARLGYDAVSDYFSQAKLMATGKEVSSFFPENHMIVSSLHPDILFTILIQAFGDQSARMLSWVNGLAILSIGYAIAKKNGISPGARLYFLILLLTSTAFTDLLGDGKVELICTTPILVAVYWMLSSAKSPEKNVFLLIGFLAGFSIISRLYNIFIVSFFVMLFYGMALIKTTFLKKGSGLRVVKEEIKTLALNTLWILPTLLAVGTFHLWQNWVWLGSPFAPLEFADKLKSSNWEWKFDPNLLNALRALYPLTVTFLNTPQSLGNVSPLFIGFLPFLLLKGVRSKMQISEDLWHLLATSLVTLAAWIVFFYTITEIRYVMFIWALLFLPLGLLIEQALEYQPKYPLFFSRILIGSLLAFIVLRTILISVSTYSPVDSHGQAYCSGISFCDFFEPVNNLAEPGDRVFALNAFRYYYRNDLFNCSTRADEYSDLKKLAGENSSAFWVELYRKGYHFIAFEENFSLNHSRFGSLADPEVAPSWLKVIIISTSDNNISYRLEAVSPPFQPEIYCRKNDSGDWQLISSQQ